MNDKPINEQLKELRNNCRLTLKELEAFTNVSEVSISHYEQGKDLKTIDTLNKILRPLNAHLEIVQEPLGEYSENILKEIALRPREPKNYHEFNFLKAWNKAMNETDQAKVLQNYTVKRRKKRGQ